MTLRFVQVLSTGSKFLSVHVCLSFHCNEPLLRLEAKGMNGGKGYSMVSMPAQDN